MKKVIIEKAGSYDQLKVVDGTIDPPKNGEVQISCRACGVNFADCCVRMGVYRSAKVYVGWPITPGFEVSGTVEAIGDEVTQYKVGDKVIGVVRFGGYASYLNIDEKFVFPLPPSLDYAEGAALPAVFLTADYALNELAHPRVGQTLLVHSAAGGVGSALVQLGKVLGCRVVGVVGRSDKVDAVLALGADVVIDKSTQSLWEEVERASSSGYDVILDANGPETLRQSYKHLASGGKLVVYGFHTMLSKGRGTPNWIKVVWNYLTSPTFNPMDMTTDNHSVMAFNLSYLFNQASLFQEAMDRILKLVEEGKVRCPKVTRYSFKNVAEAHRDLESGRTVGKLVLEP